MGPCVQAGQAEKGEHALPASVFSEVTTGASLPTCSPEQLTGPRVLHAEEARFPRERALDTREQHVGMRRSQPVLGDRLGYSAQGTPACLDPESGGQGVHAPALRGEAGRQPGTHDQRPGRKAPGSTVHSLLCTLDRLCGHAPACRFPGFYPG